MKKYFAFALLFGALCSVASYATVNKNESVPETVVAQETDTPLGRITLCEKDGTKCSTNWEAFRCAASKRVYIKNVHTKNVYWADEITGVSGFTHRVWYGSPEQWYYFSVR